LNQLRASKWIEVLAWKCKETSTQLQTRCFEVDKSWTTFRPAWFLSFLFGQQNKDSLKSRIAPSMMRLTAAKFAANRLHGPTFEINNIEV
jgi:hypothetical protein